MKYWYNTLRKAPWTPPNWVFGIVWTFLYAFMGIAFFVVWTHRSCFPFCPALFYFFIHLFFNLIWTELFFERGMIRVAFIDLCLTFIFLLITYYEFSKINLFASRWLIPYIAWLILALSLNLYIVIYN